MKTELENIKELFQSAERILNHQEEIKRLRGENFNIFYILKMESKENATHSAFLGELLNPKGSHYHGNLFLRLFLETIESKKLEIDTTTLVLEKSVGSRDDDDKTGGRIDIYLQDAKGNSISVENKIYAIDQFAQIQRYINHNNGKNTVYYLTLDGKPASNESKGSLEDGKDYYCLSYSHTILTWLAKCLRESVEQPILRESIRQYIILIKKLTNQLSDSKMEKAIEDIIKSNYQAAKIIADNVWKVEVEAAYTLLLDLKTEIEKQLGEDWIVSVDSDLNQAWSGLKVTFKEWNGIALKLEGSSKIPWSNTYYGIIAHQSAHDRNQIVKVLSNTSFIKDSQKATEGWPWWKYTNLQLGSVEGRLNLFDPVKRQDLLTGLSSSLVSLANECKGLLSNIVKL
jgi:hypothetical protein